jgi:hypothetical protein
MPMKPAARRDDPLTAEDLRSAPSGADRRREARVACEKDVAILPCRTDEGWGFALARMFDCSPRGIGIITERKLPAGDQFMVKVKLDIVRLLIYTVRHCVPADGGRYKIGAELNRIVGMDAGHQTNDFLNAMLTNEHPTESS